MKNNRDYIRESRISHIEDLLSKTSFDEIEDEVQLDELDVFDETFKGSVEVSCDPLNMHAYLHIKDSVGCVCDITFNNIKSLIDNNDKILSSYVDWDLVRSIFEDVINSHMVIPPTIIARGELVESYIPEHFLPKETILSSMKPKICKDGHVDYHQINVFTFVKKNEFLGRIIREKLGKDGRTLDGKNIPFPTMVINNYKLSNNIYIENDNFYSGIDGSFSLNSDQLEVNPILTVNGDVDYSTGDLDFNGDILIIGSVRESFNIYSKGGISVQGSIEPSKIVCENNLMVNDGILGTDDLCISCGGTMSAKYITNAHINCNKSIYVIKDIYKSNVNSLNEIIVSKHGSIIGGHMISQNNITAYTVGNKSSVTTLITLGIDYEAKKKVIIN